MKRLYLILLVGLFPFLYISAQLHVQADALFTEQNYQAAKEAYAKLLKQDSRSALYLYRYARCTQELGEDEVAIEYFERAGDRYALRDFYLGELYNRTYRFTEALTAYKTYLNKIDTTNVRYAHVIQQIEAAQKGERYLRRVTDITIVDSVIVGKRDFLQAYKLTPESGSLVDSAGMIVYTNQRNDRRTLTDSVNGRLRLLTCQRLLDGWSACDTLQIDIDGDMNYPYKLSDGITLYFGSNAPEGLGGYDIYMTRYNAEQNTYLAPENLGFPFNSRRNDYMLAIDEIKHIGYFATDRFTADSLVAIYTFIPNTETRILRDVESTYLRRAAQLRAYKTGVAPQVATSVETQQESTITRVWIETKEEKDFYFVVNNTIVCHTLQDFQSTDAGKLMQDYLQLQEKIAAQQLMLSQLRIQYAQADDATRSALTQTIIDVEKTLPRLQAESHQLTNKIRYAELQVRGLME